MTPHINLEGQSINLKKLGKLIEQGSSKQKCLWTETHAEMDTLKKKNIVRGSQLIHRADVNNSCSVKGSNLASRCYMQFRLITENEKNSSSE